jgi:carboxymethylenebutenolidase
MPGRNVANGYLSAPASGSGPGVLVIQEWWGLNSHVRDLADRFAAEGYVAFAPDLYHGRIAREPDEAGKLMMSLNVDTAADDLRTGIEYLIGEGGGTGDKVGVVGFCMGGMLALYAATVAPDKVAAVVDFYGGHPNVRPDFSKLQAPVLGLFAGKDDFVNAEAVRGMDEALTAAGKAHEFHTYPDADHAFFNDERPEVYNPEAAADAWQRTLAFFRQHLRPA